MAGQVWGDKGRVLGPDPGPAKASMTLEEGLWQAMQRWRHMSNFDRMICYGDGGGSESGVQGAEHAWQGERGDGGPVAMVAYSVEHEEGVDKHRPLWTSGSLGKLLSLLECSGGLYPVLLGKLCTASITAQSWSTPVVGMG
ncbi:NUT family member 2F [Plecturocebus cupreus]